MDLTPRLTPQTRLALTHALQRSLEILQMPQLELAKLIREEVEKNPLLELEAEAPVFRSAPQATGPEPLAEPSLHEHLLAQAREAFVDPADLALAEGLIGSLDEHGLLSCEAPERILNILQSFDPPGIFARSIQETFALQLERQGLHASLAMRLVREAFPSLLQGRYTVLKKSLGVTPEQLQAAIQQLARLSTRPAASFQKTFTQPIYPDLRLVREDHLWRVESISDALPRVRLKAEYLKLSVKGAEQAALRQFTAEAKWLLRSLERRRKFLLALGAHLVKLQGGMLSQRTAPITVSSSELAERLSVHPSTISRALSEKYIATPSGLLPLRALAPSYDNEAPKELLQRLVAQEDKRSPLTDEALAVALKKAGHEVARRTIAKYRRQLKISSASRRKLGRCP